MSDGYQYCFFCHVVLWIDYKTMFERDKGGMDDDVWMYYYCPTCLRKYTVLTWDNKDKTRGLLDA